MDLAHKEILLVAPKFFGYESEIAEALRARGAIVHYHDYFPSGSKLVKGIVRLNRDILGRFTENYFRRVIASLDTKPIQHILVIKGETVTVSILRMFRRAFPRAVITLYMWDSIRNYPQLESNLGAVDRALSFDRSDVTRYPDIKFRPLFFSKRFICPPDARRNDFDYDVSFVGTIHSDRLRVLNALEKQFSLHNLVFKKAYFLRTPLEFYSGRLFEKAYRGRSLSDFVSNPLSGAEVMEIFLKSKVIVDIHHPQQEGLTMRTLEALGCRSKIITTNPSVKSYDFYSPENVRVVDRRNPVVERDFFTEDPVIVPDALYYKYSIDGWLDDVFGEGC